MKRSATALILAALTTIAATATALPVPLIGQSQSNWCWAASGKMIMQYLGGGVSQCQEANEQFNTSGCCASPGSCNMPGLPHFYAYGFSSQQTGNGTALSFAQLSAELNANRPVAFGWNWTGGGGHMMVAIATSVDAYGNKYVTINDPMPVNYGSQKTITYSQYVSAYDHTHGLDIYNIHR